MTTKIKKPFFESTKFPGWRMNKWGVCYNDSDPDLLEGYRKIEFCASNFAQVIHQEALDHGYKKSWVGGEQIWSKP